MHNKNWWSALEALPGEAVLADWAQELGEDFAVARFFLEPTAARVQSYPCTHRFPCECRHRIVAGERGPVAVCDCGWGCPPLPLEAQDLVTYQVSPRKLSASLAPALGLSPAPGQASAGTSRSLLVGSYGPLRSAVYLVRAAAAEVLARELERLFSKQAAPFIVLTPTGTLWLPHLEARLQRQACLHLPLAPALQLAPGGRFHVLQPLSPLLEAFVQRQSERAEVQPILAEIHRKLEAVQTERQELRAAKARLEQMLSEGLFAFTRKVDPTSFKYCCTIVAEGDVAKASRALGMSDSALRKAVERWHGRGKAYNCLLELVRWSKSGGRRQKVPLNDAILYEKADPVDYPELLAEVLEALRDMTDQTWEERVEDLAERLRPVAMRTDYIADRRVRTTERPEKIY